MSTLANLPWILTLAGTAGLTAYAAFRAYDDGCAQQAADDGEGRADG
ncbi:hypothetical protein MPPM_2599 [Methylorubrum populi]|uniref:Uncharacterized protein n=1 Tax=Methylorubrum populi TaxID=223967 RepID=A0A160PF11_9HYPH|nr:hypothetical protein [Methylorubrum populi]BAU91204.1 hypothetical protein MPPM_2599 [Methylorubrum populi]